MTIFQEQKGMFLHFCNPMIQKQDTKIKICPQTSCQDS